MGWKAAVLYSGEAGLLGEGKDCPPLREALRASRQGNLPVSVLRCKGISQKARAFMRSFRRDR